MDPMMQTIDWTPLAESGIDDDGKKRLLVSVMPLVQLELQEKVLAEFTPEEVTRINQKAAQDKVAPEEGIFMLEEEYQQKTGRYFMEEMNLLLNEYVKKLALVLKGAQKEVDELAHLPQDQLDYLHDLIAQKKWEEAVKFFDSLKS